MKMLYDPPPLLGLSFLKVEPVEVEVLEVDFEHGTALIIAPLDERAVINLIRKRDGNPPLKTMQRRVLREDLKPLSPRPRE